MERRIIIHSGLNLTEEYARTLAELARQLDIDLREIPAGSTDTSLIADAVALAGEFTPRMIESAKKMRWFHSSWAGVDNLVKLAPFREKRAVLTNSAGAYNAMITEHLIAGCLMLLRNFPAYLEAQRKHIWHAAIPADSLMGKRVTVLGVGNIGGSFAKMAVAMGATVSGLGFSAKEKPAWLQNLYTSNQLEAALTGAEIVAMCLPYTKDTDKFIAARELAMLPRGARLLNIGRGKTLDTDALLAALRSGHLAGAMLDVFPEEPLPPDSPLWDVPNLIITPHVSGHDSDKTNLRNIFDLFAKNLRLWAKNEPLVNVIDIERGY